MGHFNDMVWYDLSLDYKEKAQQMRSFSCFLTFFMSKKVTTMGSEPNLKRVLFSGLYSA
jgi:hypothetical protein